jgi:hypothetical protein
MTQNDPAQDSKVPRPRPSGALRRRDKWLLVGLAVAVVVFSAISVTVNALRPDVPTTSNSSTVDPRVQDSDYVLHLGSVLPPDTPQVRAIAMGRSACASLDAGTTRAAASNDLIAGGLTEAQAAAVLAAAVEAYCPAHR